MKYKITIMSWCFSFVTHIYTKYILTHTFSVRQRIVYLGIFYYYIKFYNVRSNMYVICTIYRKESYM